MTLAVAVPTFLLVTGCLSSTGSAETQGAETPQVTYSDARYHYRIDGPGHMTAQADGTASVVGPSERLEVAVVQGARAADPAALAQADVTSLGASLADFHLLSHPAAITLAGQRMVKFVYTWAAGTSQVTGKPLKLTGVRYYIAKDPSLLAVVTYGISSSRYDPQGADDIASTFKWL